MYKNAPLVEAVCEVRFSADSKWDLAIPGLVYDQLKEDLPLRKPVQLFEAQIGQAPEGLQRTPRNVEFLQFSNESESRFVRIGLNVLSVHNLGEYPGWTKFCPRIESAISHYVAVATPKDIEQIGLRFVNRIRIPAEKIDLEDYFAFFPYVGKRLPQPMSSYMIGVEFPYDEGSTVLRLELASDLSGSADVNISRLDFDYFNSDPASLTLTSVHNWLKTAHERIEQAFEASITDKLRAVFNEGK